MENIRILLLLLLLFYKSHLWKLRLDFKGFIVPSSDLWSKVLSDAMMNTVGWLVTDVHWLPKLRQLHEFRWQEPYLNNWIYIIFQDDGMEVVTKNKMVTGNTPTVGFLFQNDCDWLKTF